MFFIEVGIGVFWATVFGCIHAAATRLFLNGLKQDKPYAKVAMALVPLFVLIVVAAFIGKTSTWVMDKGGTSDAFLISYASSLVLYAVGWFVFLDRVLKRHKNNF